MWKAGKGRKEASVRSCSDIVYGGYMLNIIWRGRKRSHE